jgi:hypothetical protein
MINGSILTVEYPNGELASMTFSDRTDAEEWAMYHAKGRGPRDVKRAVVITTTTYEGTTND